MKKLLPSLFVVALYGTTIAQETLQTVTNNGNTTTNDIVISKHIPSLYLNGAQINGINYSIISGIIGVNNAGFSIRNSTASRNELVISETGKVGIGTGSPVEKLTIEDGNIRLNRGYGYLLSYASLSETHSGASTILGNNVVAGTGANTIKRNIHPVDNGSFVSLNYYHGITFHTGINSTQNVEVPMYDSEKLRITQNGDVGIGTATPREKLSVNGKIRAHEVKVETSNWPDYVFAEDYKLKTLPELEAFIKKNRHLPEVPSAKQVEQEGLALGEMNKILLKKVEELTLHLIEKEKSIQELAKRVEKLENPNSN